MSTGVQVRFGPELYANLIKIIRRRGMQFGSFVNQPVAGIPTCYLRHDVDFSLQRAVALAALNAELGVKGTFFLLLRSHAYNLLSWEGLRLAHRIHELGQDVALHCALPNELHESRDHSAVEALVARDYRCFREELPFAAPVVAWHNTRPWILDDFALPTVASLRNVYAPPYFRAVGMCYVSDSVLRKSPAEMMEAVQIGPEHLHLLLHPVYWVEDCDGVMPAVASAWCDVVRLAEKEMLENSVYASVYPRGIPDNVLQSFARLFHSHAGLTHPETGPMKMPSR